MGGVLSGVLRLAGVWVGRRGSGPACDWRVSGAGLAGGSVRRNKPLQLSSALPGLVGNVQDAAN